MTELQSASATSVSSKPRLKSPQSWYADIVDSSSSRLVHLGRLPATGGIQTSTVRSDAIAATDHQRRHRSR